MKKLLVIASLTTLAACAPITKLDQSPTQTYRLKGSEEALSISGDFISNHDQITGGITRNLTVKINGEQALSGPMQTDASGHLSGRWREHFVETDCTSKKAGYNAAGQGQLTVNCTVLIDNERAAVLTF